jgi:glycosyltransferase involved in cell wall biosynthesis
MKKIDLIIAVRNEEENLKDVYNSFLQLSIDGIEFGLIFIEDGSSDNTLGILRGLSASNKKINYFSLLNPYGPGFALSFGISKSDADAVITMDADGSHPFEAVKCMVEEYKKGFNVVQGHRIVYDREKHFRKYFSYVFHRTFSLLSGVNFLKQNVHFRLMDTEAKEIFIHKKRWWYSVRVNFNNNKIKSKLIEFVAPERTIGESKFNFTRLFNLALRLTYNLISLKRFLTLNALLMGLIAFISYLYPPMIIFTGIILFNFYLYFKFNNENFSKCKILENN